MVVSMVGSECDRLSQASCNMHLSHDILHLSVRSVSHRGTFTKSVSGL